MISVKHTTKQWNYAVEQFAYIKSKKCINMDKYKELLGGLYTYNDCCNDKEFKLLIFNLLSLFVLRGPPVSLFYHPWLPQW